MISKTRIPQKIEKKQESGHGAATKWTCPKCKRQFERTGQTHSCRLFPIEQHFAGKDGGKLLYEKLLKAMKKCPGPLKVESLTCCIHFVSSYTFAAVKVYKQKLLVEFALTEKIQSPRIKKWMPLSGQRYLYYVEIGKESEIDKELMNWITEAKIKRI